MNEEYHQCAGISDEL